MNGTRRPPETRTELKTTGRVRTGVALCLLTLLGAIAAMGALLAYALYPDAIPVAVAWLAIAILFGSLPAAVAINRWLPEGQPQSGQESENA